MSNIDKDIEDKIEAYINKSVNNCKQQLMVETLKMILEPLDELLKCDYKMAGRVAKEVINRIFNEELIVEEDAKDNQIIIKFLALGGLLAEIEITKVPTPEKFKDISNEEITDFINMLQKELGLTRKK